MSYAIVNIKTGKVFERIVEWLPNPVVWPNGDASHAASVGDERDDHRLVEVIYQPDSLGEFYSCTAVAPSLQGATLIMTRTWTANDLDVVQARLTKRIDDAAEAERLKYITPGSGQAMVYLQKKLEADAYLVDAKPDLTRYPLLSASAIDNATVADTAKTVLATANNWTVIAATIEKIRLTAKNEIMTAKTVDEAALVVDRVVWS